MYPRAALDPVLPAAGLVCRVCPFVECPQPFRKEWVLVFVWDSSEHHPPQVRLCHFLPGKASPCQPSHLPKQGSPEVCLADRCPLDITRMCRVKLGLGEMGRHPSQGHLGGCTPWHAGMPRSSFFLKLCELFLISDIAVGHSFFQ